MFISINGFHFPINCFRALSCNASQDTLQTQQQWLNAAISKSQQAMVPCLEAQKEIPLSGLIHKGLGTSLWEQDLQTGKKTPKLKRSKSVKFNFLFSGTENVFLQILKLKSSYNPFLHVCDLHDICLLGDALFTVQLFLIAMAYGIETDDQR